MNNSFNTLSRKTLAGSSRVLLPALFFLSISGAQAFKLLPIRMEFEPAGRGANQAFRLENDSSNTVPVQISMLTRQMDLDGKETNAPAEDDFLVYPPQILLKPGQVQTVRVKFLGNPKPQTELAYRILAEQLPVDLEKEKQSGARISLLVRYLGSVYVLPKNAKAEAVLESANPQTDAEGKHRIELVLNNRGKAHALLQDLRLKIQAGSKTVELGPEALTGMAGENILAGQTVFSAVAGGVARGASASQFYFHQTFLGLHRQGDEQTLAVLTYRGGWPQIG